MYCFKCRKNTDHIEEDCPNRNGPTVKEAEAMIEKIKPGSVLESVQPKAKLPLQNQVPGTVGYLKQQLQDVPNNWTYTIKGKKLTATPPPIETQERTIGL